MSGARIPPSWTRRRGQANIWQLGIVRAPAWITGKDRPPYRPKLAIAVSLGSGLIGISTLVKPEGSAPLLAADAVRSLRDLLGELPGEVHVCDPEVGAALRFSLILRVLPSRPPYA